MTRITVSPPLSFINRRMPLKEALESVSLEALTEHMGFNICVWDVFGVIVSYDEHAFELPAKLFDVRELRCDASVDEAWKLDVRIWCCDPSIDRTATATLRDMGPMGKWLSIHIEPMPEVGVFGAKTAKSAPPKGLKIRRKARGRVTIKR